MTTVTAGAAPAHETYARLLEKLAELAQTLGTARDLLDVFRGLRDFAMAHVPFTGIFISLYDPERSVRRAVYAWSEGREVDLADLPPLPFTGSPASRAVETGEMIITDDFQAAIAGKPVVNLGLDIDPRLPRSSLAAPMAVMGRIVGGFEVQSCEAAAFTQEHARMMRMAANLAAIAIENVRLLERERSARASAEEASRLKDEFLAVVSHELRTPLTSIFGWIRLLRTQPFDAVTAAHAFETIERNARSQVQLVEDLLDASAMITGKVRLRIRPLELAGVVQSAVDSFGPAAHAKAIRIESFLEPGTGLVAGDPERLLQIVWNLLSNAIKFTPPGGRVDLRISRASSSARLEVSDTGQGIHPEFLPHVFDRFRQADSSSMRSHGGLGLGLAIVRHLVELHGGSVKAASRGEGQGATFTVDLPLATPPGAHEDQSAPPAAASPPFQVPLELKGLHVLVVDDEPDTRELLLVLLTQYGASVRTANSAAEALEELGSWRADVLVSDIGLPREDGYAFIRKVRSLAPEAGGQIPAIALTAHASPEDRIRAISGGYQRYVRKPVEPAELVALVASLARGSGPT